MYDCVYIQWNNLITQYNVLYTVYCILYLTHCTSYYRGISLELGGKSPLIVFEDAHIDSAVDWIITGFLWGSGQVCRIPYTLYRINYTVKQNNLACSVCGDLMLLCFTSNNYL